MGLMIAALPLLVSDKARAQGRDERPGALIALGYTNAPDGDVIVGGDPEGGATLVELRVRKGQQVSQHEIIAVLSNYHKSTAALRLANGELRKLVHVDDAVLHGTRVENLAAQETSLRSTEEETELRALQRRRSNQPLDQRVLEANLDHQKLQRQRSDLQLARQALANDQALQKIAIARAEAFVEHEQKVQEQALVRAPISGTVIHLFSRAGERVDPEGILRIVDMRSMQVLVDVDELNLKDLRVGAKAQIVLRGMPGLYQGTVTSIGATLKRMQAADAASGSSTDGRAIQVRVSFDQGQSVPEVLGLSAKVLFGDH